MRINRLESSADIDLNVCVYKYFKRVGENGLSAVAIAVIRMKVRIRPSSTNSPGLVLFLSCAHISCGSAWPLDRSSLVDYQTAHVQRLIGHTTGCYQAYIAA